MADKFNVVIQIGLEAAWEKESDAMMNDGGLVNTQLRSTNHERYAYATALFFFSHDAPYRHIPYNIKYEGRTDIGRYFGQMLGRRLGSSELFKDVDCVIPVPLHWIRRWRRGYNQAEIIAREVADVLGAPLDCNILVRRRRTRTQTKLDIKGKTANVAGAFAARTPQTSGTTSNKPKIQHILLIDDVFTTGATLYACFTALRAVFPPSVRISVATLAFVGEA
jgi:ComF family protein